MTITEQALTTARTSHTSEASTRLTQPTQTNNEQSTIHPLITPLLYQSRSGQRYRSGNYCRQLHAADYAMDY